MNTDAPAIEARSLSKRYGPVAAVDALSFAVPRGSVTGFLGPNGAGKTTTMRLMLGLATPTSGTTTILGVPYAKLDEPLRRVGAALEITGFHPGRTARDHLRIACLEGGLAEERADAVLAMTGMGGSANAKVRTFSFGMKQRLALAAALLGEPTVLILDEPANGLDPAGVAWLRGFLRRFATAGGAVLMSSHILAEVAEVADRVVVIDRGRLVTQGSVAELTAAAGARVIARSPSAAALRAALERAGAVVAEEPNGSLSIRSLSPERVGEVAAAEGLVLHELRGETSSLEDAFLALTGDVPSEPPARPDAGAP